MLIRGALFAAVAALAAAQTRSGSIAGRVLNQETGEPIRKAAVHAIWDGTPRSAAMAVTDGSGRFVFDLLPPGQYGLRAEKQGFASIPFGAMAPFEVGKALTLAPGENKTGIDLKVVRLGSISGVVIDQDGDPIVRAGVQLLAETYERGTPQWSNRNSASTNDRGEYRIADIMPGRYYLQATAGAPSGVIDADRPHEIFQPLFYPGVADAKKASPIFISGAQQIHGIDFRLGTARVKTLRGRITGVPDGPNPNVSISVLPVAGADRQPVMRMGAGPPPDYPFALPDVPPGAYRLVVDARTGDKRYRTIQRIEVGENTEDVVVPLTPAVRVQGLVRYEGDPALKPAHFLVRLVPGDGLPSDGDLSAEVGADGQFTIEQVPQGIWDIAPEPIPRGGYLKSMYLGKQDVLTEEMAIEPGTNVPLNIVISSRGARVEGSVDNGPAVVMLAPWGKYQSVMSFYHGRPTDDKGRFEMTGITPGEYLLFAFKGISPNEWLNPAFVERFAKQATPLTIAEGEKVTASLKAIATEKTTGDAK